MGDYHDVEQGINDLAEQIVSVNVHPNGMPMAEIDVIAPCIEVQFSSPLEWGDNKIVMTYKVSKYNPKAGEFYAGRWGNEDLENLVHQILGKYIKEVLKGTYRNDVPRLQ